jgi:hypothetical protein
MEPITARVTDPDGVCGQKFENCRVALFSFADDWYYPQPYLNRQLEEIESDGLIREKVHLGSVYAALVVLADGYTPQAAKFSTLPLRFALAKDEAEAGAPRTVNESVPPSTEVLAPSSLDAPDFLTTGIDDRQAGVPVRPIPSRFSWIWNSLRLPLALAILGLVLLFLMLSVSGQRKAFSEALEHFLRESIYHTALRLSRLQTISKAKVNKLETVKSSVALMCFVMAIGVAVASFEIIKFSLELLLPISGKLALVALVFCALKGVGGILLHFFEGHRARKVVAVTLILGILVGVILACRRTLALQELNNIATAVSVVDSPRDGVIVNGAILDDLRQSNESAPQVTSPSGHPESSLVTSFFSLDVMLVGAMTLVMDMFEILCIFGAFHLSANAVVWALSLPLTLPVGLAKEGLWLIFRSGLMRVISILIQAALEAPVLIAISARAMIRSAFSKTTEAIRRIAGALIASWREQLVHWRRRKITRLRRRWMLERLRLHESHKTAETRALKERNDDRLASMLRRQQMENQFHERELKATLEHSAMVGKMLRDKGTSALDQKLEETFARTSADLVDKATTKAERWCESEAEIAAEEATKAIATQLKKLSDAHTAFVSFISSLPAKSRNAQAGS